LHAAIRAAPDASAICANAWDQWAKVNGQRSKGHIYQQQRTFGIERAYSRLESRAFGNEEMYIT
jgi:hypothetical protein